MVSAKLAAEFSAWCAPRAVAALADCSPIVAARGLLAVQEARGRAPDGETARLTDAVTLLEALGFEVTPYGPATAEPVPETKDVLADYPPEVQRRAREMLVDPETRAEIEASLDDEPSPRPLTVAGFLDRQPAGAFLIAVWPAGHRQHVLAARDGRIIAGDRRGSYSRCDVVTAHRIAPNERRDGWTD